MEYKSHLRNQRLCCYLNALKHNSSFAEAAVNLERKLCIYRSHTHTHTHTLVFSSADAKTSEKAADLSREPAWEMGNAAVMFTDTVLSHHYLHHTSLFTGRRG